MRRLLRRVGWPAALLLMLGALGLPRSSAALGLNPIALPEPGQDPRFGDPDGPGTSPRLLKTPALVPGFGALIFVDVHRYLLILNQGPRLPRASNLKVTGR